MPELSYIIIRTVRKGRNGREDLCSRVKQAVRLRRLALQIPMIKFERGTSSEFYYGLAVNIPEADDTRIPECVECVLNIVGEHITDCDRATWPTPAEEVKKSFMSGAIGWDSFGEPIVFEPGSDIPDIYEQQGDEDPFTDIEIAHPTGSEIPDEGDERYDKLLWWCTAKGNSSFSNFSEICALLELGDERKLSWSILRRLTLLGHMEFTRQETGHWAWGIAPASLVQVGTNSEQYFLAGQRTPFVLSKIYERWGHDATQQSGGPSRTSIYGDIPEGLTESIGGCLFRNVGCAAMRLAEAAPDVSAWKSTLSNDPDIQSYLYAFERYQNGRFDRVGPGDLPPGLYRASRKEGPNITKTLFHDENGQWLMGDYYGLRFLSSQSTGIHCKAKWYPQNYLLVPEFSRWPMLYERALVLASGLLPTTNYNQADPQVLQYSNVGEELARTLCQKLNVELEIAGNA